MSEIRYATIEDYKFVYNLWLDNISDISILNDWKDELYSGIINKNLIVVEYKGFCLFSIDKKNQIIFVKGLCVDEFCREGGIARSLVNFIIDTFNLPVVLECFKDTVADNFCKSIGSYCTHAFSDKDRLYHNYYVCYTEVDDKLISKVSSIVGVGDKENYRVINCRFKSREDLEAFKERTGFYSLVKDTKWYDVRDGSTWVTKTVPRKSVEEYWRIQWVGMPEFQECPVDSYIYTMIEFRFDKEDLNNMSWIFQQKITEKTKAIWYPKLKHGKYSQLRVVEGLNEPRYPIYIVSKNRSDLCYTSRYLTQMEVNHFVVVEPDDYEKYVKRVQNEYATILVLDMKYKDDYDTFNDVGKENSTGPGAARNFCWDDSIKRGYKWHWVFDDNATGGFMWLYKNAKIKCRTGAIFRACEDFVDRYDNIALAGINYSFDCPLNEVRPAFVLNTRIYSFLLIRNDIEYRWRGRYNEDTDLSLRVLKDGWCTVEFNAFLAGKVRTQRVRGGNTEEFYAKEGTLNKSRMLQDMHPDVARVVWKFGRWHHEVDYSGFTQKLHYKEGVDPLSFNRVNNYGMIVIPTNEKENTDSKSYLEKKYKNTIQKVKGYYSKKEV